jgi:hypothetical protein
MEKLKWRDQVLENVIVFVILKLNIIFSLLNSLISILNTVTSFKNVVF